MNNNVADHNPDSQSTTGSAAPRSSTTPLSTAQRWLLVIGACGPLGRMPASGTVTVAVIGIPLYWATRGLSPVVYTAGVVLFSLASVALHQAGDKLLGEKDSRALVWDELVGFLIAVAFLPFTWPLAAAAFFLERAIDILKVWPARHVEDRWPGGWGVVGDDVVAGLYTLAVLHVMVRFFPGLAAPTLW